MRILSNKNTRKLFVLLLAAVLMLGFAVELYSFEEYGSFSVTLLIIALLFGFLVFIPVVIYFRFQDRQLEKAVECIRIFLEGDKDRRIECSEDGELYRLFHEINTMASVQNAHSEREIQTNEFLKQTIFDISHQLKTPLAALNIYNGLVAEADSQENIQQFTQSIEHELDRIESLIKKLLTLTRLDAGAVPFEKTPQNVQEMLEDVKERFSARMAREGKTICLSGSNADSLVCDRGWLSEAISNIVQNALDHTDNGGIIEISWTESGNMLSLLIKDNGCGIQPEDINNIFKRFYRSRNSSDKQGIGLGLPLARTVIEAHDGTILVDSRPGQGTCFTINFINPIPTKT